jgi:hypothetical protein
VLIVSGATALALQARGAETGDRINTSTSVPASSSPTSVVGQGEPRATSTSATPTTAPSPRDTGRRLVSVSVRISADRTRIDDACAGFGGVKVHARITAGGAATVRYRWHDGSSTLDEGSRRFRSSGSEYLSITYGNPLAAGESTSARVTIAASSPAGHAAKTIKLSFSCDMGGNGNENDGDDDGDSAPSSPPVEPPGPTTAPAVESD